MPKSIDAQTYQIRQVRDTLQRVGMEIALARKARKWSQAELGERLGDIDRRHISAMEKGDPTVDFGLVISAAWVLKVNLAMALMGINLKSKTYESSLIHKDKLNHALDEMNRYFYPSDKKKKEVSNDF